MGSFPNSQGPFSLSKSDYEAASNRVVSSKSSLSPADRRRTNNEGVSIKNHRYNVHVFSYRVLYINCIIKNFYVEHHSLSFLSLKSLFPLFLPLLLSPSPPLSPFSLPSSSPPPLLSPFLSPPPPLSPSDENLMIIQPKGSQNIHQPTGPPCQCTWRKINTRHQTGILQW